MDIQELEAMLLEAGYRKLFYFGKGEAIEEIWAEGENEEQLKQLIKTPTSSLLAKFLAGEVLRAYDVPFSEEIIPFLAPAYVTALEQTPDLETYQLSANRWGLLYEVDDPGVLGRQVIGMGKSAIPHLSKLLDNDHIPLYEGSAEATFGSAYNFRIKDFAAFYLSKITNTPITFFRDLEARDIEIARFQQTINHPEDE